MEEKRLRLDRAKLRDEIRLKKPFLRPYKTNLGSVPGGGRRLTNLGGRGIVKENAKAEAIGTVKLPPLTRTARNRRIW
jgi:hypothetical protein